MNTFKRHRWQPDPTHDRTPADLDTYAGRVCVNCGCVQRKVSRQNWGRVVGYEWTPEALACVRLEWAKAERGRQATEDGRYWVARELGGCFGGDTMWFAYRDTGSRPLGLRGFRTRRDAKRQCEDDARSQAVS